MVKNRLKKIVITTLGERTFEKIRDNKNFVIKLKLLILNFLNDLKLFYLHSNVFKVDTLEKIEASIILDYHSIEKGMLFAKMKPRFGEQKIKNLHKRLNSDIVKTNLNLTQINVAYQIMCQYYELHEKLNYDISDFFAIEQYQYYKNILNSSYSDNFKCTIDYNKEDFYKYNEQNFEKFSKSRKSIRNFTGEKIDISIIKKAIQLSLTAPSVCNRQSSKVYLLENKVLIDKVLKIQGGMSGYTDNMHQLLILTTDRNYFYTVGERNQMFIDGGVFLMNLLYSLHFFKIANCPANWGKTIKEEKALEEHIKIPKSEKIICMIPIGVAQNDFKVALSLRRDVNEVFKII